ncbi:MAG: hypothetical protein IJQ67_04435 [Bacilli bacterium]|nr:hypothetical protein [Bacilli bacterium]
MKQYEEFKHLKIIEDKHNPFCTLYEYDDGSRFYIEPAFYTQLLGFKEKRESDYPRILKRMEEVVRKNKRVVFTSEYENPQTEVEGYIYLEISDITDPLNIYVEDKSRGSDYGD